MKGASTMNTCQDKAEAQNHAEMLQQRAAEASTLDDDLFSLYLAFLEGLEEHLAAQ